MPNWKKVILSGSNAILNQITASGLPDGDGTEQLIAISADQGFVQVGQGNLSAIVDNDWHINANFLSSSKSIIVTGSISASEGASFLSGAVSINEHSSTELHVEGNITASNHISASGNLFASLSLDSTAAFKTVMYDTATGQFFHTGSYGGGGGGGGGNAYTTIQIGDGSNYNTDLTATTTTETLRINTGSNISVTSITNGSGTDSFDINAIPTGSSNFVQFNNDGLFGGNAALTFDPDVSNTPFRSGRTNPAGGNNNFGLYSGSHLLNDKQQLVTNARFVDVHETYHLIGFGRKDAVFSPGGASYGTPGNAAFGGTGGGQIPSSATPDGIASTGLNGTIINSTLVTGGPYIVSSNNLFTVFSNQFASIPGSPGVVMGNGTISFIPSESFAYDAEGSGSLITPAASASGRITLTENPTPNLSTFNITGRRDTRFQTGESGSESNYLMYETSTSTVGIGKGITGDSIKNINTSRLALVSGGLSIHGGAAVETHGLSVTGSVDTDTLAIKNQGQLNYTPQFRNEQVGNFSRFYFLGALATKQKQFRDFPDNKIEVVDGPNTAQDGVYFDFRGGAAGRPDDATGINFGVSETDFVTPIRDDGTRDGIRINSNPTIEFFNSAPTSSVSGTLAPSSASAQIKFDTGSNAVKFFAGSRDEDLKEVLHISKSGDNPRIGIGTTDPKTVFDFKDIEDSNVGAELLIRSARTSTTGALSGDEGGSINFVIDSGSFADIKTSGSIAKIKTKVTDVGFGGVAGKLALELSKTAGGDTVDAFEYGFSIGGQSLFAAVQTASLVIKDFSDSGESVLQMRNFDNNLSFEVSDGDVGISGSLGVTGSANFKSNVDIDGTLSLGGFNDVSASLAAAVAGGDNLGNHTATTTLDLDGNSIKDALHITASGNISASGTVKANSFIGTLTGTATGLAGTPNITVGSIEATSLNVTSITSSIVTSSIIQTEGSNIFGDTISDTQTFNGHITASGNISASGTIIGSNLSGTNTGDQDLSSLALKSAISGAFVAPSASFSTRVTANETIIAKTLISSSAQIASDISGSFTAASASFSTRVTTNDAKVSYTDAAVTSVINAAGVVSSSAQTVANLDGQSVTVDNLSIKNSGITNLIQNDAGSATHVKFSPQGGLEIDLGGVGNSISASQDIKTHGDFIGADTHIRLTTPDGGGGSGLYLSSSGDLPGSSFKISVGDIEGIGNSTLLTVDDANEQITTSKALGVTGNITVTGTVDGRDVAADGTKLDGITAAGISGSFTAVSASFSTRIAANEVVTAKTLLSSSAQIASDISGSITGRNVLLGNITASGNVSASGQIIAEAGPTINTTLASNTATNIDTFNTSSNNGAIYDYTLFSAPSGARAGQCMVIHHNGNTDFTDTSTPTLGSETSIPFFETAVNGANVEVKIASGSGYTFKAFIKKL